VKRNPVRSTSEPDSWQPDVPTLWDDPNRLLKIRWIEAVRPVPPEIPSAEWIWRFLSVIRGRRTTLSKWKWYKNASHRGGKPMTCRDATSVRLGKDLLSISNGELAHSHHLPVLLSTLFRRYLSIPLALAFCPSNSPLMASQAACSSPLALSPPVSGRCLFRASVQAFSDLPYFPRSAWEIDFVYHFLRSEPLSNWVRHALRRRTSDPFRIADLGIPANLEKPVTTACVLWLRLPKMEIRCWRFPGQRIIDRRFGSKNFRMPNVSVFIGGSRDSIEDRYGHP